MNHCTRYRCAYFEPCRAGSDDSSPRLLPCLPQLAASWSCGEADQTPEIELSRLRAAQDLVLNARPFWQPGWLMMIHHTCVYGIPRRVLPKSFLSQSERVFPNDPSLALWRHYQEGRA